MNLNYEKYCDITYNITNGFFPEGAYFPACGRANMIELFVRLVSQNEEAKAIELKTMGASGYIDKVYPMIMDEFAQALKDDDYFSFGSAVKDAEEMIKFRRDCMVHASKFEDLLDALINKVNELDKNISPEDLQKVLEAVKRQKPIDESAIVEEYWKRKKEIEETGEERV